jgi:ribosomal protein L24
LFVEGITREKVDGTAIQVPIHPSKVMITSLNLDDKRRRESLKVEAPKEAEKPPEAPVKERRKRKPRKAAPKKAKAPRKKRTESETKKEGEAENG